eukprot:CAMPEP_0167828606 /NCGR_PEP_ID=MMETSP0112_2-20121227/11546_1 /TAXON_ID=91324 /ORGANISM="Lotharella globosa, Strain CCCM811" /LENGTH=2016 /DNA_ID=CAMNT_0007731905 /DNA_START=1 /DNA_END=6051 /DNA_ORIENTATION=+
MESEEGEVEAGEMEDGELEPGEIEGGDEEEGEINEAEDGEIREDGELEEGEIFEQAEDAHAQNEEPQSEFEKMLKNHAEAKRRISDVDSKATESSQDSSEDLSPRHSPSPKPRRHKRPKRQRRNSSPLPRKRSLNARQGTWGRKTGKNRRGPNAKFKDRRSQRGLPRLHDQRVDQRIVDQRLADARVDQRVLDQRVLDQRVLDQRILEQRIADQRMYALAQAGKPAVFRDPRMRTDIRDIRPPPMPGPVGGIPHLFHNSQPQIPRSIQSPRAIPPRTYPMRMQPHPPIPPPPHPPHPPPHPPHHQMMKHQPPNHFSRQSIPPPPPPPPPPPTKPNANFGNLPDKPNPNFVKIQSNPSPSFIQPPPPNPPPFWAPTGQGQGPLNARSLSQPHDLNESITDPYEAEFESNVKIGQNMFRSPEEEVSDFSENEQYDYLDDEKREKKRLELEESALALLRANIHSKPPQKPRTTMDREFAHQRQKKHEEDELPPVFVSKTTTVPVAQPKSIDTSKTETKEKQVGQKRPIDEVVSIQKKKRKRVPHSTSSSSSNPTSSSKVAPRGAIGIKLKASSQEGKGKARHPKRGTVKKKITKPTVAREGIGRSIVPRSKSDPFMNPKAAAMAFLSGLSTSEPRRRQPFIIHLTDSDESDSPDFSQDTRTVVKIRVETKHESRDSDKLSELELLKQKIAEMEARKRVQRSFGIKPRTKATKETAETGNDTRETGQSKSDGRLGESTSSNISNDGPALRKANNHTKAKKDQSEAQQHELKMAQKRKNEIAQKRKNEVAAIEVKLTRQALRVRQSEALLKLKEAKHDKAKGKVDKAQKEFEKAMRKLTQCKESASKAKEECTKQRVKMMALKRELAALEKRKTALLNPHSDVDVGNGKNVPEKKALKKAFHDMANHRPKGRKTNYSRIIERRLRSIKKKQVESRIQVMKRLITGKERQKHRQELLSERKTIAKRLLEEMNLQKNEERARVEQKVTEMTRDLLDEVVRQNYTWIENIACDQSWRSMQTTSESQKADMQLEIQAVDSCERDVKGFSPTAPNASDQDWASFQRGYGGNQPLNCFRASRLRPDFPYALDSQTFSHKINPFGILCRFDLHGRCNDEACTYQHIRDCILTPTELVADYASYSRNPKDLKPWTRILKPTRDDVVGLVKRLQKDAEPPHFASTFFSSPNRERALVAKEKCYRTLKTTQNTPAYQRTMLRRNRQLLRSKKRSRSPRCKRRVPAGENQDKREEEGELKAEPMDELDFIPLGDSEDKKDEVDPSVDEVSESESESGDSETDDDSSASEEDSHLSAKDCCRYATFEEYEDAVAESPKDVKLWVEFCLMAVHSEYTSADHKKKVLNILSRSLEANPNCEVLWILYLEKYIESGASTNDMREILSHAVLFTHTVETPDIMKTKESISRARLRAGLWNLYVNTQTTYRGRVKVIKEAMKVFGRGVGVHHFYDDLACMMLQRLMRVDLEAGQEENVTSRLELWYSSELKLNKKVNLGSKVECWLFCLHVIAFRSVPSLISAKNPFTNHLDAGTPTLPNPQQSHTLQWWSRTGLKTGHLPLETLRSFFNRTLSQIPTDVENHEDRHLNFFLSLVVQHWATMESKFGDPGKCEIPTDLLVRIRTTAPFVAMGDTAVAHVRVTQGDKSFQTLRTDCLKLNPCDPFLWYSVSNAHLRENRPDQALQLLLQFSANLAQRVGEKENPSIPQDSKDQRQIYLDYLHWNGQQTVSVVTGVDCYIWLCLCLTDIAAGNIHRACESFQLVFRICVNATVQDLGAFGLLSCHYIDLMIHSPSAGTVLAELMDIYLLVLARGMYTVEESHRHWAASCMPVPAQASHSQWRRNNKLIRLLQRFDKKSLATEFRSMSCADMSSEVISLYVQSFQSRFKRGSVYQTLVYNMRFNYKLAIQWAQYEIKSGSFASAKRALRVVTRRFPRDPTAWSILAYLDAIDGNIDTSQKTLLRGLEYNPASYALHQQLIKLEKKYAPAGQADEAVEIAKAALGEDFLSRKPKFLKLAIIE